MLVRKSLGDPVADDLRYVAKSLVGEENFVDMHPNRSAKHCCGGGGGLLQAGMTEHRRAYSKRKFDQIQATGANYVLTPCHDCHSQMEDIGEHLGGHYHVVHFWTLICLSLGILGENERRYLGRSWSRSGSDRERGGKGRAKTRRARLDPVARQGVVIEPVLDDTGRRAEATAAENAARIGNAQQSAY